jgi:hypothetical protein
MDVGSIRLGYYGERHGAVPAQGPPSEGAVVIDRPEGTVAFAI